MKHHSYKNEWLLLVAAFIIAITSLYLDYIIFGYDLFNRSGSIIVLISAIVEFRVASHIYDDIQRSQHLNKLITLSIPLKGKPTKQRKRLLITTHSFLIIGTLIWGYGDLLQQQA